MNTEPGHRRNSRRLLRFGAPVTLVCLLLVLSLLVAGCGGSSSDSTTTTAAGDTSATTAASTAATTAATTTMSGSELGKAVGVLWTEAMQKMNTLVADFPSAAEASDGVTALKEEYIQKLVALGKQREALDASGKAEADSAITAALSAAADEDWYATYLYNYDAYGYEGGDVDFVNLIGSFNILTQYANFDLLKKQEPAEATRLGIE
jgi:hypothetical protein